MVNNRMGLRGKRKLAGFWLFASILYHHIRQQRRTEPLHIVGVLYGNLQAEEQDMFKSLQDASPRTRHMTFLNILRSETSLRFI